MAPAPHEMAGTTREHAEALDAADDLAPFRSRFRLPDGTIYLDGNSLGPPSDAVDAALASLREQWEADLVTGWDRWLSLPLTVGDALGAGVLGASAGRVAVADSTTINLYKAVAAALSRQPTRSVVVLDRASFPTDRYIVAQLASDVRAVPVDEIASSLDYRVAVVVASAVDYRTAALAPLEAITEAAHRAGALVVWDLSHAAGAVPLYLDEWDVDFAVGCTYKYLNAVPGAPAYLYVTERLHDVRQPIPGWFGHVDQFAMEDTYRPASGIARFLTGTPNVPGTVAVEAGVRTVAEAGIDRIRAKNIALTELAIARADELGLDVASPREATTRGSHVAVRHADAAELCAALVAAGVVCDFRPPDIVRLGFSSLYTRYVDAWDGVTACAAHR